MVWVWASLFIVTLVVEILTFELVSVWFSIGSLVAFILAICKVGVTIQIVVFLVVSVVLLASLRFICVKFLKNSKEKTNLDSLIGTVYPLKSEITEDTPGEITINGIDWRVVSKDGKPIKVGERVKIVEVKGNKFIVTREEK